jgi:hypothetical protein
MERRVGSGCAVYDHAIVDATPCGYPRFGTRSLRLSTPSKQAA